VSTWAEQIVASTRAVLGDLAEPERAVPMAAYMRHQFSFIGVAAPARRAVTRAAWRPFGAPDAVDLEAAAVALWALDEREFQYAGCDLLARYHHVLGPEALVSVVQPLIVSKSWWDTVDALRTAAVGPLVSRHRALVDVMRAWIEADNHWLIRSALIHQLGFGREADAELLFAFCFRQAKNPEFFVAKAIGWALRSHGRVDPDAVREFVAAHPELSTLARREALKNIDPTRSAG
jgi:3-methyladenine DNA glycosylase AlkD